MSLLRSWHRAKRPGATGIIALALCACSNSLRFEVAPLSQKLSSLETRTPGTMQNCGDDTNARTVAAQILLKKPAQMLILQRDESGKVKARYAADVTSKVSCLEIKVEAEIAGVLKSAAWSTVDAKNFTANSVINGVVELPGPGLYVVSLRGWTDGAVGPVVSFPKIAVDEVPVTSEQSNPVNIGGSSSGSTCKKPRYYTYTLSSDLNLTCDTSFEGRTKIFNVSINDEGFSIARASLKLRNNMSQPGGWSANAYYFGGGGVSYDMADNINPGDTKDKTVLGSGNLRSSSTNNQVLVSGYHYGASSCSSGGYTVLAGSTLEVWVEDPKTECQGKYLGLKSYYQTNGNQVAWGNDFLSIDIPATTDSSEILLMSSVEGTLLKCVDGSLSTILSTPYHSLIGNAETDSIPTKNSSPNGLCHLSLATSNRVSYSPSVISATLHPRNQTNTSVYSGLGWGEALIGFVKEPR